MSEMRQERSLGWLQKLAVQAGGSTSKTDPSETLAESVFSPTLARSDGGLEQGFELNSVNYMRWNYTKHVEGKISVSLDNNVWNLLFRLKIDLSKEFPSDRFALFMTREVEIETLAINAKDKADLSDYIAGQIADAQITTTYIFGWGIQDPQRFGGWGQGVWQSDIQREFYAAIREQYLVGQPLKGSRLNKNEADAAVAAQSFSSIVLTCERATKTGPLRFAHENGGQIIFLADFDPRGPDLRELVEARYSRIG